MKNKQFRDYGLVFVIPELLFLYFMLFAFRSALNAAAPSVFIFSFPQGHGK